MKKILVITDLYPVKECEKNTPRTIYKFVQSWKKLGHEVKIIKPNFLLNSFLRKKPFYKTGIYNDVENINYFLPFLGNIKTKVKTKLDADIVIAHMPSGILFADKLGLPFCAAVHSSDIEVLTNPIYKLYFKPALEKAYNNAIKIACRSEVLRKKFLSTHYRYANKTFCAPSGVDGAVYKDWNPKEKIKVLTCGQFIKRKNIDKVIKASEKFDNIELTVVGDGKENLRKISKKPIFTGHIPHNKVLELMQKSDIFILPSVNETFGMVYLEAMASGCITICTENDGVDGIIKDGFNGFLTTPNNVEETLSHVINYTDKNFILKNAYETMLELTEEKAAINYINYLADYMN